MRKIDQEVLAFYDRHSEDNRLVGISLEKKRTQELISRFLGPHALIVLVVGGGTGVNSFWLSELGHEVHLLDASPGISN